MSLQTIWQRVRTEDEGVLTFEWILLISLVVLGIVGGYSAVRDGVVDELGDVAEAIFSVDKSWSVEDADCDTCNMNFGSYTDPITQIPEDERSCRQRACAVSQ